MFSINKFLCKLHHLNNNEIGYETINFKKFYVCKLHSNLFCFYCIQYKKKLYIYCKKIMKYRIKKIIKISKFQRLILIKRKKKIIIKIKKTLKKTPN